MSLSASNNLLIASHELKDQQCKGFVHEGINLFIVRHQGQVVAYVNSCPHRKVPLEWVADQFLDYDKQFIQCATHGALFTIDSGRCISGPCNRQSLQRLAIEERGGGIYLLSKSTV
ncbi:MAG TPA: Rieske (2Fe-2S) protein [Oceanospirillaceae bacterium]|jgi:nitrite reductase/ring-hydroxylating ferredoxin subunit|nr:Rieske (2Fe-2S) protein [Oceanospirillaceae bacterium]